MITKIEAESFKGGGMWALYQLKEKLARETLELDDCYYFGALVEEEKDFHKLATYYLRNGTHWFELPLPDKETLKKLNLMI